MSSPIYTSKKLEKLILKYLKPKEELVKEGILGKWNATVFYLNRKKNWLLFNSKTHFSLVIIDIKAKDLPSIQEKIHQELFLQLVIEGMDVSHEQVIEIVGDISFFSTDADRKALGHMNQILLYIEDLVYGGNYSSIDQINAIINTYPFSLDGGGKYTNLSTPQEEMAKILGGFIGPERAMPIHPISLN